VPKVGYKTREIERLLMAAEVMMALRVFGGEKKRREKAIVSLSRGAYGRPPLSAYDQT